MGVKRQFNFQSQARVDVPHMRLIESAIAGDFDSLAGYIISGKQPLVVKGFSLDPAGIQAKFDQLKVVVAGSALLHYGASESGTVFTVSATASPEQLTSTNTNVSGSFVTNADNYVGLDLVRKVDDTTRDKVAFLDSGTKAETSKNIPLGRTLNYRFVISARSFSSQPNVLPLAIVSVDVNGFVTKITDARKLLFRLGSGGDVPNTTNSFTFSARADGPNSSTSSATNPFISGDKDISSQKQWQDGIMTRLWEIAGGEYWYSRTAAHDLSMTRTGAVFTNGDYYEVVANNVHWQGISFVFTNSTAARNDIANQTGSLGGTTDLAIGECVYVDLDRTADHILAANWQSAHTYAVGDQVTGITGAATGYVYEVTAQTGVSAGSGGPTGGPGTTGIIDNLVTWKWVGYTPLVAKKATMSALGAASTTPGSRVALIWRTKAGWYARGTPYTIGTTAPLATNIGPGIARLNKAAAVPSDPVVVGWNERDSANGVAGVDASVRVIGTGLTRDAAGILTIGDQANDTSVAIGKTGANTNVVGTMSVTQLLSLAAGLDSTSGALTIGGTTATGLNLSRTGQLTKVFGTFEVVQGATFDALLTASLGISVPAAQKINTPEIEGVSNAISIATDGTTVATLGSSAAPAVVPSSAGHASHNEVTGLNIIHAWAVVAIIGGSASLLASHGITLPAQTNLATGQIDLNITQAMSNTNYCLIATGNNGNWYNSGANPRTGTVNGGNIATGSFSLFVNSENGSTVLTPCVLNNASAGSPNALIFWVAIIGAN